MPRDTDAEQVYRRLRDMIVRTELAPGMALVEADLLARTGFGRTPVRDALHRLGHEGLVEIVTRRGTFVTQVTISDLQKIFEVRSGIESIVATLAVEYCTPEDLARLGALIESQRASSGDEDGGVAIDGEVHRLLVQIGRNRFLAEIYQRVSDASLRLLYLTRCGMESKEHQAVFMAALYDALSRQDGAALERVLHTHIREFRARVGGSIFGEGFGEANRRPEDRRTDLRPTARESRA